MQIFLDFMELVSFWKCCYFTHRKYYKTTCNELFKNNKYQCKFRPRTEY